MLRSSPLAFVLFPGERLVIALALCGCPRHDAPDTGGGDSGHSGGGDETGHTGESDDSDALPWRLGAEEAADATMGGSAAEERFGAHVAIVPGAGSSGGAALVVIAEGQPAVLSFDHALAGDTAESPAGAYVREESTPFGDALAGGVDLDGDGGVDLVVAERSADTAAGAAGAVWVLPAASGERGFDAAFSVIEGGAEADEAGSALSVTDLGAPRLCVGVRGAEAGALEDAGEAWIFAAPLAGTLRREDAFAVLGGAAHGDYAGRAVDIRGDFDGDGVADALVGAYRHSDGATWTGAAYIVLAPSGEVSLDTADAVMHGTDQGEAVGRTVRASDDLDGDGRVDAIVGASGWNELRGAIYVFVDPSVPSRTVRDAFAVAYGEEPDDSFSVGLGSGDLDADGQADLVVGAPGERESQEVDPPPGWVGVIWGPVAGTWEPADLPVRIDGNRDGDAFGTSLSADGDLDGDGRDDLAVGAYRVDAGERADAGAVYLFSGLPR